MSYPQTINSISVPIPVKGMNKRDPLVSMEPVYAPWMLNWEPEPQYCRMRYGYTRHSAVTAVDSILGLMADGNTKLYAFCKKAANNHTIYDVTTSTPALVHTLTSGAETQVCSVRFMGRSAFMTGANWSTASAVWNGSAWSAWGYTLGGNPVGGDVAVAWKGYTCIFDNSSMVYGALGATSGATTEISFASIFEGAGAIQWAATLKAPNGLTDDQYLCFGNSDGEILVYGGRFPEAPDWGLVGQFRLARPCFTATSALSFQNDVWLLTEQGIVSLRKLFEAGSDNIEDILVTGAITTYWVDLMKQLKAVSWSIEDTRASIVYWRQENKIYISTVGHIDRDGVFSKTVGTMFVYNLIAQAWTIHKMTQMDGEYGSLVTFRNNLYYKVGNVVMKVNSAKYADETYNSAGEYTAFPVQLESAYMNFGNMSENKRVFGFEPIIQSDISTDIGMKAVADFGRESSQIAYDRQLTSTYLRQRKYAVGVKGSSIQYRFEGTSNASSGYGFKLYGMGVLLT